MVLIAALVAAGYCPHCAKEMARLMERHFELLALVLLAGETVPALLGTETGRRLHETAVQQGFEVMRRPK